MERRQRCYIMSEGKAWGERTLQGIYKDFVEPVTSWFTLKNRDSGKNNVNPKGGVSMRINMNRMAEAIAQMEGGKEEQSIAQIKETINRVNIFYKRWMRDNNPSDVLRVIERTKLPRGRPKNGD